MITEFTCGIYTATDNGPTWPVTVNDHTIANIEDNGNLISFVNGHYITTDMLIEMAVLMNNIKRQYKQLNPIATVL